MILRISSANEDDRREVIRLAIFFHDNICLYNLSLLLSFLIEDKTNVEMHTKLSVINSKIVSVDCSHLLTQRGWKLFQKWLFSKAVFKQPATIIYLCMLQDDFLYKLHLLKKTLPKYPSNMRQLYARNTSNCCISLEILLVNSYHCISSIPGTYMNLIFFPSNCVWLLHIWIAWRNCKHFNILGPIDYLAFLYSHRMTGAFLNGYESE